MDDTRTILAHKVSATARNVQRTGVEGLRMGQSPGVGEDSASLRDVAGADKSGDVKKMTVTLPWPPKELSPNARVHWSKKSKSAKAYRLACYVLALEAGLRSVDWEGKVHIWLDFYPPDKRQRDDDNLVASFKSGRDGLADALGIDDKRFVCHPMVREQIGGMVKITLTPGPT